MFFSQFSMVGLGMSPGSKSPSTGKISVKVSQSQPEKPAIRPASQLTLKNLGSTLYHLPTKGPANLTQTHLP